MESARLHENDYRDTHIVPMESTAAACENAGLMVAWE